MLKLVFAAADVNGRVALSDNRIGELAIRNGRPGLRRVEADAGVGRARGVRLKNQNRQKYQGDGEA